MDQMDLGDFTVKVWFKALSAPDTWSRFFGFGKGRPGVFLSFLIIVKRVMTSGDCHFSGEVVLISVQGKNKSGHLVPCCAEF